MSTTKHRRSRKLLLRVFALVGLLVMGLLAPARTTPAIAASTFRNALNSANGADPWLTYYNGNYYLAATTWTSQLTMRKSPTIDGLKTAPMVQVWADTEPSRCCNFWAPEFYLLNGPNGARWYMYYTAGTSACCGSQHTHVLESAGTDPMGPYTYKGRLYAPGNDTWAIDGSVLQMNGSLYFLFSAWQGDNQNIYIAPMSNPWTISGGRVLISTPTYGWETVGSRVNEGPVALQHGGKTFIVYSASFCGTPDYKLGMLTYNGGNVLSTSSWVKKSTPVFQRSDSNGVYGPGHNGFFTSPDGSESWIVYHANSSTSGGCDNNRTTRVQKFTWNSDGTPNFGTPVATSQSLSAPSGESGSAPGDHEILNRNSGKALDVTNCGTGDGVNVQQWSSLDNDCQRWEIEDLGNGYNRVVNVNSGKVLDVTNCGAGDGVNVQQWSWLNNSCQQWSLVYTGSGYVRIVNRNSGKVLDAASCGTGDGVNVQQWSWLNTNCQQWALLP